MALRSMTGFGRGEATFHGVHAVAEIGSVNRRQLDVHISLPRHLSSLDARIAEEAKRFVTRGRLTGELMVSYSDRLRKESIHVDETLAASYLAALRATAGRLGLTDDLQASLLLELPDVVRYDVESKNVEHTWPAISRALRKALRGLVAMRTDEGQALQQDLEKRVHRLESELAAIARHAPKVAMKYREALVERLAEHKVALADGDDRLLREIAMFADKCDINEEVARLGSHFAQARKMMKSASATGKSLDFLAQEMFREINTIGSKANHSRIAQHVVNCKTELDRFREQVQNIE